jgi:hypothetical protein
MLGQTTKIHTRSRRLRFAALVAIATTIGLTAVLPSDASNPPAVFRDGFDASSSLMPPWTKNAGLVQVSPGHDTTGFAAEAKSTSGTKAFVAKTIPSETDVYVRLWFEVVSQATKTAILRLRPGSGQLLTVSTTPQGAITIASANASTPLTSTVGVASAGAWHLLQVHMSEPTQQVETWLDGVAVAKLTKPLALGSAAVTKLEVGDSALKHTFDIMFDTVGLDTTYIGPTVPTNLQAQAPSGTEVDLTWDAAPRDDGPVSYKIYRGPDASTPTLLDTSISPSYVDPTVTPSTSYDYWVEAVDGSTLGPARTAPVPVTTGAPSGTVPSQPTGLSGVSPATWRVDLSWNANPLADGVSAYDVFRSTGGDAAVLAGSTTGTSFRDTSSALAAGTAYTYTVEARNGAGSSPDSDPVTLSTQPAGDPTVAAAGDIACDPANPAYTGTDPKQCQQQSTANLIASGNYTALLPLGDDQYECGALSAFQQVYDSSWGAFLHTSTPTTYPVPGNHEYNTGTAPCSPKHDAAGYFGYFSSAAYLGDPSLSGSTSLGYYSFDIAVGGTSWHLIALNAECHYVSPGVRGGCASGSPQEQWLASDLASHTNACTIAYWHQPLWGDANHSDDTTYQPFWNDLYAHGAELVLNGHVHLYNRFIPQTPGGVSDPTNGLVEIIAGTGGAGHAGASTLNPMSAFQNNTSFGILVLTLHSNSYEWQFVPVGGGAPIDQGAAMCHGAPTP